MRSILLVLCVILPLTASGQYQTNPNQQQVWQHLSAAAPIYEVLIACDNPVVADLFWDSIKQQIRPLVGSEDNMRITRDMWTQARGQSRQKSQTLLSAIQDQDSTEFCNTAERIVVERIGAGA